MTQREVSATVRRRSTRTWLATVAGATLLAGGFACGGGGSSPAAPTAPPQTPAPPAATAPSVSGISPSLGSVNGGAVVTITGAGFAGGASVSLGGTPATSIVVNNSTSITATTPARASGAADIVVTNPDGQSGRLNGGFTYESAPVPSPAVTSIDPGSGGTSGGTVVTISGSGFAAGAAVSFGGTAATAVTINGSSTITATAPARGAGGVDIVVTNPDGQSGRLTNAYTYTGSAPPPPPAAVAPTVTSIAPASATTAGGTSVTIAGAGFAAGATVSFGGAAASSVSVTSATTITATTPAGAAGAVDVTVTNADGLNGRLAGGFTYTAPAPPPPPPPSTVVVITITPAGVSPSDITISPGTRVRFVNNDFLPHQIGSDPHPEHTLCPPINDVGLLLPGQSRDTAVFTVVRSCGYHDHNDPDNPLWTGTIQVK